MLDRNPDGPLLIGIIVGGDSVNISVRMKDYTMKAMIERVQTIENS